MTSRLLLRLMLILLALAALGGIAAVFIPGLRLTGRVYGTLFAGIIAVGVAMGAMRMFSKPSLARLERVALSLVAVGFILTLTAIWGEVLRLPEWPMVGTTMIYIGGALAAVLTLLAATNEHGRIAGRTGFGFTIIAFVTALIALWWDWRSTGEVATKLLWTSGATVLFALPICASLWGCARHRYSWWLLGAAAGAAGLIIRIVEVWRFDASPTFWTNQMWLISATLGAVNVLAQVRLAGSLRRLAQGTSVCAFLFGLSATAVNIESFGPRGFHYSSAGSLAWQCMSASAILLACGVLAVAVTLALTRRKAVFNTFEGGAPAHAPDHVLGPITAMTVICPHCGLGAARPLGESRCAGCGLHFLLRIAEPRCAQCEYPILGVRTGVCPECGGSITAQE